MTICNRKYLRVFCVLLCLLVCTACHSGETSAETTDVSTVSTEPTIISDPELHAASTAPTETSNIPTESTDLSTEHTPHHLVFDVDTLPAYDGEVLTDDAVMPAVITSWEADNTSVRYYTTWDITNGTLSELIPCFSHKSDNYQVSVRYWDGKDIFWLNGTQDITPMDARTYLENPIRTPSNSNNGICRYSLEYDMLYRIDEKGELAELPLPPAPDASFLGLERVINAPFYTHYNGERILMLYYEAPDTHSSFTLVYGFYHLDTPETVQWNTLTLNGEYMDITFTNFQACYCDGLLYIPSYDNVYVIDLETEEAWRIAEIDHYTALVPEREADYWPSIEIRGCYNDIVVATLLLYAPDGSSQSYQLAIRKGRVIGSYSRTFCVDATPTFALLDENGDVLYSDNDLATRIILPTFPRVD